MGNCYGKSAKCGHASSDRFSGTRRSETPSKDRTTKVNISAISNVKAFTFAELKAATRNFRSESLIGEGGFGYVFKGWIDEQTLSPTKPGSGIMVAVKKLKSGSFQGHNEWLAEVNNLGQLRHPNLVKLIGYCLESDNRLLVYEYLPRGSLENHLFRKSIQPIPWTTRMNIAIGVARGLSFLHSIDANVIYRDIKASNILLDLDYNAKLSDFGLARAGPTGDKSHVSTRVVGTRGYAAPEYVATGHLTPKNDVYGFGVVLLELLTGKRVMDDNNDGSSSGERVDSLVDWAKPFLSDRRRFLRIMDTRLGGQYPKKKVQGTVALILRCLDSDPRNRPTMADVLNKLEELYVSSSKDGLRSPAEMISS